MLTVVERVLLLSELEALREVPSEELARLAAACREDRYRDGENIHSLGDPGDAMHVVVEGAVRLERPGHPRVEVRQGQSFGAWDLLDPTPRGSTATALGETRLLTLERPAFLDVLSDHVRLAEGILRALVRRVRRRLDPDAVISELDGD